jgi:hypothetical protein
MTNDPNHPPVSPLQSQMEQELLQLMLQSPVQYPWNPSEPGTAAYFAELEQEVVDAGWSTEDLAEQGQILAAQFEQIWSTVVPVSASSDLFQRLSAQVPQQFLDGILQQARRVVTANLSLADQLIQCVQSSLPNWQEEDLQVLARPFAYAMRDEGGQLEATLRSVRCAAWEDLSSVEQARLGLALARYAIDQNQPKSSNES